MNPVIGLLTDFGNDFAVASIKGVLLSEVKTATIIDIDHNIEKFSIISGAFVINQVYHFFPQQTYFLCIVDPGVGSVRREIYVERDGYHFVGPDNGVFTPLFADGKAHTYLIDGKSFNPPSHTFHGRDLFAPALAAISQGQTDFLTPIDYRQLVHLNTSTSPVVAYIDSFGNIKTSLSVSKKQAESIHSATISCNGTNYHAPFVTTFAHVDEGILLCYKGSNNTLEIAINRGNAQKLLDVHAGSPLNIALHQSSEQKDII